MRKNRTKMPVDPKTPPRKLIKAGTVGSPASNSNPSVHGIPHLVLNFNVECGDRVLDCSPFFGPLEMGVP
jgi:hypothetical protein